MKFRTGLEETSCRFGIYGTIAFEFSMSLTLMVCFHALFQCSYCILMCSLVASDTLLDIRTINSQVASQIKFYTVSQKRTAADVVSRTISRFTWHHCFLLPNILPSQTPSKAEKPNSKSRSQIEDVVDTLAVCQQHSL